MLKEKKKIKIDSVMKMERKKNMKKMLSELFLFQTLSPKLFQHKERATTGGTR